LADEFVRFTNDPLKAALFLPGRRNQATFNAFSISEDGLVTLFQPAVTQTHSIKTSKLDFIWDAISKAQGLATGQAAKGIQGLYPTETKKWRLVSVPRDEFRHTGNIIRSSTIRGSNQSVIGKSTSNSLS